MVKTKAQITESAIANIQTIKSEADLSTMFQVEWMNSVRVKKWNSRSNMKVHQLSNREGLHLPTQKMML